MKAYSVFQWCLIHGADEEVLKEDIWPVAPNRCYEGWPHLWLGNVCCLCRPSKVAKRQSALITLTWETQRSWVMLSKQRLPQRRGSPLSACYLCLMSRQNEGNGSWDLRLIAETTEEPKNLVEKKSYKSLLWEEICLLYVTEVHSNLAFPDYSKEKIFDCVWKGQFQGFVCCFWYVPFTCRSCCSDPLWVIWRQTKRKCFV